MRGVERLAEHGVTNRVERMVGPLAPGKRITFSVMSSLVQSTAVLQVVSSGAAITYSDQDKHCD
ncbi:hypothetical protein F3J38_02030 [Pantoea sp. Acro-805]|uniref:Uncharacterized protein n=1 Tax=Candidatus Pantoea formicae TaxID=2608355 RepID=A0ABX0QPH9_9GAMM|nr:hypothetical protein [Pantoea formicae]MDF7647521.1 hypothetical protein [Erwiniaceae bacterium L1_54_3]NIE98856.1 hypothetical protein [Pantoea formicae]